MEQPFLENVKTNSAQKRILVKGYEYLQTHGKYSSYCAKAVLNRLSDTFCKLAICAFFNVSFD